MSTNLTDDITPNASLNSFDPRLLVMFAKASYGDSCNNEIITGNTKTERMQSVLNSWVQANKTATTPWEIIDVDDSHSGFQGFAAGRDYDGDGKYDEIIFAFAGTNSLLDKVTSDFQILINQIPGQANKAEEFYNEVMYTRAPSPLEGISAVFADNINPNAFVTFTGHSLGGSIAQIMAVNHDKSAVTFNAPGMKWQCDAWESDAGVVNFVNMNDPIGCYRAHVGTTLYYMPDGIVNSEFKPHSDYFEQDFSKYITLPSSVQWNHRHAASLQIYDTKHKGLFTSSTLELWANKEYLEKAVEIVQKYFGSKGTLQRAHEYEAGGSIYFVGDKKAETIYAGKNDSLLYGNDGSDKIYGGKGDDSIYGGDDNDLLNGNRGNDKIYGGSGNDTINGGMGNDTVDGGEGYDTYSFTTGDGNDTISEGADYRDGKILINGAKLKSIRLDEETNEYTTNISDVTAAWSGQDGDDLVIYYGKENNRDVITIKNFADKDYDIEVKENGGGGGNGDGDGGGGGGGAGNIPDDDDEDTNNCICGNEECGHNNNPEGCECTPEDCLCGEEDKPHRPEDDNNLDEDGMLTTNHNRYEEDFNSANEAPPFVIDPVLIDLNGDGIKTTSVDKGAYFDHENDGFEELSAWVDDNDGILVIDKNNNKKIDGGNEIFGDNYIKDDGTKATSGFDALSDLDSNNDGKIDSNDEKFNDIKILKGDGTFLTLEEAGVVSIGLDSVTSNTTDENGNTIISQGTYTKTDGTTGTIGDFQLQTDKSISLEAAKVSVSSDIEELPDIKAHGMVHSLHQAMALDSTGELQQLVESYITASSSETKRQLVKQMLYKWTNAESVVPNSRGSNVDARDLHVLEQFLGEKFVGIDNTGNPNNQACNFINSAFSNLQAYIYAKLESKTTLAPIFDMLAIYHDTDADIVSYDLELIEAHIDTKIQEDASAGKELLASFAQAFSALGYSYTNEYKRFCEHFASLGSEYKLILDTADKSVINGSNDNDNIEGTAKDEVVFAGAGNDTIHSRQGNDVVYGEEGDDYIDTCEDDDYIDGGSGNDTILAGDGNDTVYGGDGDDSIDTGSGDDVIYGGAGNDTIINNNNSSDYIDGGAGNDNITTFGGHDTIIGGAGDDYINNSGGDDTYIYNLGDGNDTIQDVHGNDVIEFGEGITTNNIKFRGENNDMIIEFEGNEGSIRVKDCFNNEHNRKIDSYKFSDGTILSYDEVASLLTTKGTEGNDSIETSVVSETIYGYSGNDTILAGDGNDTVYGGDGDDSIDTGSGDDVIYGGAGNDTIINNNNSSDYIDGGAGNDNITTFGGHDTIIGGAGDDYINNSGGDDTYIYNLGDGNDTIQDVHGNDVIEFGEGITTNNIKFRGENNDMIIEFEGNEGSIRVKDCFNNEHNRKIDSLPFSYSYSPGSLIKSDKIFLIISKDGIIAFNPINKKFLIKKSFKNISKYIDLCAAKLDSNNILLWGSHRYPHEKKYGTQNKYFRNIVRYSVDDNSLVELKRDDTQELYDNKIRMTGIPIGNYRIVFPRGNIDSGNILIYDAMSNTMRDYGALECGTYPPTLSTMGIMSGVYLGDNKILLAGGEMFPPGSVSLQFARSLKYAVLDLNTNKYVLIKTIKGNFNHDTHFVSLQNGKYYITQPTLRPILYVK